MRIALPEWNEKLSTLLDTAGSVVLFDTEGTRIIRRSTVHVHPSDILKKIIDLADLRTDLIICGALSREMDELLQMHGITVLPRMQGTVDEVIRAWLDGTIGDGTHNMTGVRHDTAVE